MKKPRRPKTRYDGARVLDEPTRKKRDVWDAPKVKKNQPSKLPTVASTLEILRNDVDKLYVLRASIVEAGGDPAIIDKNISDILKRIRRIRRRSYCDDKEDSGN
jgi:hypothetical protein